MKHTLILILLCAAGCIHAFGEQIGGRITDASTGEPVEFASVLAIDDKQFSISDQDGNWTLNLRPGRHRIAFSFVGYASDTVSVTVPRDKPLDIRLKESATELREVVITSREGQGLTSTSRIDRSAMEHLQPTSFTDLLELLPGNMSQTPDMGKANTITLRETGAVTATGAKTDVSDDYAITSLGTVFMVDGAPVNGDATLQGVPSASSADPEAKRNMTNRGVDMRTISTDNIESVEIVRGIPSAEYGNLTSGVVNIKRIHRATPFTARFKADEYSKLFSAGKGFAAGNHVINVDAGFLDSKSDPRDPRENYKRANGSLRGTMNFGGDNQPLKTVWTAGADYTGSFDNVKVDPDLNYNKIDEYESAYNRWAVTSDLRFSFPKLRFLNSVALNSSLSYQHDRLTRRKQVAPQRASVAPTSMEAGVHDGHYLLSEYVADFVNDGKPLTLFLKLHADGRASAGTWAHSYKAGAEWSLAKNLGDGQVYDLTRPLSAAWTTRPRAFSEIPALKVLSFYAEDNMHALLGAASLDLQAGVRTIALTGLDRRFALAGKVYADPRLNAVFNFPSFGLGGRACALLVAGGFGLTTKMPTVDYLYPQAHYNDMIQLNYYDPVNPVENSRVSIRTYIDDPTNYSLKAARNRKWEVRVGADWGGNRLSVTFFEEHMNSGFRYSAVYAPYALRRYDASGLAGTALTAPPELSELPYTDVDILDGYRKVTNGSRIDKRGIEYQLNTVRWPALRTSLIINGAWFRSRYSNSQMLYATVTDVVGGEAVSDSFVGLYDTDDGRINEQFNTNFMFDTQIPRWGLVFSTSLQCMWYLKTTRLRDNGTPAYYMAASDGELHPYTEGDASDLRLQYLIKHYNEAAYLPQTVPPAIYLNLKATKQIGRLLKISAFVNRIVDYLPDYKSNGLTIRRTSNAYFGMEANFTF